MITTEEIDQLMDKQFELGKKTAKIEASEKLQEYIQDPTLTVSEAVMKLYSYLLGVEKWLNNTIIAVLV